MAIPVVSHARRDGRTSHYVEDVVGGEAGSLVRVRWCGRAGWERRLRLVPDGSADIAWDGERLHVVAPAPLWTTVPVLAGQESVGVRLQPATFGLLRARHDESAPPGQWLGGRLHRRLIGRLRRAAGVEARQRLLVDAVLDLADRPQARPDDLVTAAIDLLRGGCPVATTADRVALSARELHRRFVHHVGLGPKEFQRIARFEAFLALADGGDARTVGALAADAGYWDQAHLHRECRRLTGRTPAQVVRLRGAARDGEDGAQDDCPGRGIVGVGHATGPWSHRHR